MRNAVRVLLVFAMFVGLVNYTQAQRAYAKGDLDLKLGFGINTSLGFTPVYFGGNYMILEFLSAGAEVDFRIDNQKFYYYGGSTKYNTTGFGFITYGDYHFNELLNIPAEFDVSAGIDLGVAFYSGSYTDLLGNKQKNSNTYFLAGPHVGGKWFFSDKFGLHAKAGFRSNDGAIFQFGITMKMK